MPKKIITDPKKIDHVLSRGVEMIYPNREALETVLQSGKRLRIYYGIDPTGKLHVGHGVELLKLRQLQELGHEVIVLIGDFTGMIGDPTDKAAVRKQLTRKEVLANAKNYKKLIGKILDLKQTSFKTNSTWLSKLSIAELVSIMSNFTAQQTLARGMFKTRLAAGQDLFLHEFLYPLMQAYDSVAMDVDMEIGGNDQMFNMMAGRTLLRKMKNKEKFVLTMKLLVDPTGKKMGKTEGNMVNLDDAPNDMYGKVMSWPDTIMMTAFEILTDISDVVLNVVREKLAQESVNPRDIKMQLAHEIVRMYHGEKAAIKAQEEYKQVFQQGNKPTDIATIKLGVSEIGVLELFVSTKLATSNSEARRLIKENALKIDDKVVSDEQQRITIPETGLLLQRGKKMFVRVKS
ncbi:MAG: tyrosine--tRNA ligase [Candidatus Buchananbacteria bacterium]|nr:tyrosine--tRNA ligase [Candidatus Buchananbacteria bacterium]